MTDLGPEEIHSFMDVLDEAIAAFITDVVEGEY